MSLESAPTVRASDATAKRPALLAPYLAELRATADGPAAGAAAPGRLELESWEAAALTSARPGSWQARVAEALAYRLRCSERLRGLGTEPEPEFERDILDDEWVVDAALGLALQQDLKSEVDLLVASGQVREAKLLTALVHKLAQSVTGVRSRLGDEAFSRAEELVPDLIDEATRERCRSKSVRTHLVEDEAPAPVAFKRDVRHAHAPVRHVERRVSTSRVRPLLWLFVASLLGYMILIFPRTSGEVLPRLGLDRFEHIEGIVSVRSRPPSLFIEVDATRWRGLGGRDRQALVDNIGTVADEAGYSGAHIRSTEGQTVGEWLRLTGAQLHEVPAAR